MEFWDKHRTQSVPRILAVSFAAPQLRAGADCRYTCVEISNRCLIYFPWICCLQEWTWIGLQV
jgi:hypothetical protein